MTKDIHAPCRRCQNCNKEFIPSRKWQKFCSPGCKAAFWSELRKEAIAEILKRRKGIEE